MSEPEPLDVDALASSLRADTSDLEVYARVLTASLAEALPAGVAEVERTRSLADRIAGRPGTVSTIRVVFDDVTLELAAGRSGQPRAQAVTRVGGVAIAHKEIGLAEWSRLLAERLAALAAQSEQARAALGRMLGL